MEKKKKRIAAIISTLLSHVNEKGRLETQLNHMSCVSDGIANREICATRQESTILTVTSPTNVSAKFRRWGVERAPGIRHHLADVHPHGKATATTIV